MVAVVVIISATVSTSVLGIGATLDEPAPNVAETTGAFEPGASEQEVLVTHVAGDNVRVENIEIVVRASGPGVDTEARLVNLPAGTSDIDDVNIDGDDSIISEGFGESGPSYPNQVIIEDFPADNNIWEAGETIQFEINVGGADFREPPSGPDADTLEVVVVHTPSGSTISEHTFTP
jgi:FlaG/FlaF family flagellin (archaellin)